MIQHDIMWHHMTSHDITWHLHHFSGWVYCVWEVTLDRSKTAPLPSRAAAGHHQGEGRWWNVPVQRLTESSQLVSSREGGRQPCTICRGDRPNWILGPVLYSWGWYGGEETTVVADHQEHLEATVWTVERWVTWDHVMSHDLWVDAVIRLRR